MWPQGAPVEGSLEPLPYTSMPVVVPKRRLQMCGHGRTTAPKHRPLHQQLWRQQDGRMKCVGCFGEGWLHIWVVPGAICPCHLVKGGPVQQHQHQHQQLAVIQQHVVACAAFSSTKGLAPGQLSRPAYSQKLHTTMTQCLLACVAHTRAEGQGVA